MHTDERNGQVQSPLMRRWLSNTVVVISLGISILCIVQWARSARLGGGEEFFHSWYRVAPRTFGGEGSSLERGVLVLWVTRTSLAGPLQEVQAWARSKRAINHDRWEYQRVAALGNLTRAQQFIPKLWSS